MGTFNFDYNGMKSFSTSLLTSCSVLLITFLPDTDMEKTLLSMLGETTAVPCVPQSRQRPQYITEMCCVQNNVKVSTLLDSYLIFNDLCFLMHLPVTILRVVGMFE